MNISWDAEGYERGFSFVPAYGAGVIDLIDVRPGEKRLDLGCGNGALTAELAARGLDASGMDASPEMVALAREHHPELRFCVGDATSFSLDEPVDVVFSNAMLHWIDARLQPSALACVAAALRMGGQFVFECGGHGCGACGRADRRRGGRSARGFESAAGRRLVRRLRAPAHACREGRVACPPPTPGRDLLSALKFNSCVIGSFLLNFLETSSSI